MSDEIYNLIKTLGESKFNSLVKEYNKSKYDTWDVNIVNGPYDGGIDLVIRVSEIEIRKSIQITVQVNNFEKKLEEDLDKAKNNVQEYGYLNDLQFFTPFRVTKSKQNKLEREAEINYGIKLQIIDGWKIAEDCEEFKKLGSFVYSLHNININTSLEISKDDKIVFDYLALSKDSAEVKKSFIQFYILSFLQDNPLSSESDIIDGIKSDLISRIDSKAIKNQLYNLLTKRKVIKSDKKYSLSNDEHERLNNILSAVNYQEALILKNIEEILNEYNCGSLVKEIFVLIRNIFQVNFGFELNELSHKLSNYESDIKGKFKEIENCLRKNGVSENNELIVKRLIDASCQNEYFSKVSVASLYTGLFQNDKLDRYLGEKELFVCLDTQALLRFICVKYRNVNDYSDKSYGVVKGLIECISSSGEKLNLFTTMDYLSECVSHLWSAVQLEHFFIS